MMILCCKPAGAASASQSMGLLLQVLVCHTRLCLSAGAGLRTHITRQLLRHILYWAAGRHGTRVCSIAPLMLHCCNSWQKLATSTTCW